MGFANFNPFKRERQNFPGVVIPLASDSATHVSPDLTEKDDKASDHASSSRSSGQNEKATTPLTLEALRAEVEADIVASGSDTSYDRKAKVVNRALQDIGMGRYQWELFALCGCGWLADNLWLQGIALTLTPISYEFGISESHVRFTTCALFLGLCIGASFWGIASDIVGRRLAFNMTLFLAGTFGLAAGGGSSWIGVCALYSCLGLGVGGNLPVDGTLFLEFLPMASGNMLTLLSVWWPVGQLISSLLAWAFIPPFTCASADGCTKSQNWGWRYLILTLGAITFCMFISRFFFFHLYESPKYLLSRGRQEEAVASVHGIAYKNKTQTWLTNGILNEIGGYAEAQETQKLTVSQIVQRFFSKFSMHRIRALFVNKRLGVETVLLWFIWATIGMGYPLFNAFLPQYLAKSGGQVNSSYITYRNYAITSIVGVPGSILACWTVEKIGRKATMAAATLITGVLLFCFTISPDANTQLGISCVENLAQNMFYGVLYAYTPEVYAGPVRGTATGICSCLNRIAGLCAPLVAVYASGSNTDAPIYASGGLILAAAVAMICLPIETRGRAIM
ncbi:MFS-type transporter [Penicillium ucsense]|uniref:MFS-type transporter n=1 Tax=Penicillium ucsense TaxID=2839758 RepID=A0A8J8VW69_9EURO|nr:MFS-type transporter [Penicillium ucsense]KAF7729804.1 MFS-type transporter [Penicillium ucsense]